MPADRESLLLGKFTKVSTHLSNPSKEFGGIRLFQLDLDEALGKNAVYMAKPSLPGLLTVTQVVMNTSEKGYFKQWQHAQDDTKRKSTVPTADPSKKSKAGVGDHCHGCSRPNHRRDDYRQRDAPGWNAEGRWIDSKTYKALDAANIAAGHDLCYQARRLLQVRIEVRSKCKSVRFSDKDNNSLISTTRY